MQTVTTNENNSGDAMESEEEITQDLELLPESEVAPFAAEMVPEPETEAATRGLDDTGAFTATDDHGDDTGRLPAVTDHSEPESDAFAELQYELEHLRAVSTGLEKEVQVSEDLVKRLMDELNASQAQQDRTEKLLAAYGTELATLQRRLLEQENVDLQAEAAANPEFADAASEREPAAADREPEAPGATGIETTTSDSGVALSQVPAIDIDDADAEPYPHRMLILRNRGTRKKFAIEPGHVQIGSSLDNDIHINSSFISRHHAEIVSGPGECLLKDLGSTNGIYVNSRRVRRHVLRHGDSVVLGKHQFEFVEQQNQPENCDKEIPTSRAGT